LSSDELEDAIKSSLVAEPWFFVPVNFRRVFFVGCLNVTLLLSN
jgi:hypothetical protein